MEAMANVKSEPGTVPDICEKIIALCQDFPEGVGDKVLQNDMPDVDPKIRAKAINTLLNEGKIDLFKVIFLSFQLFSWLLVSPFQSEAKGLLYRLKSASASSSIKGDQEEKIVYKIIEDAGNKGSWIRDIRQKSNLVQTQLNRVLKALENKKLIKVVKSVNATRKKVYM